MNVNPFNYREIIEWKMSQWYEVASRGAYPHERSRARQNLRKLVMRYPQWSDPVYFEFLEVEPYVQLTEKERVFFLMNTDETLESLGEKDIPYIKSGFREHAKDFVVPDGYKSDDMNQARHRGMF